MTVSTIVPAFAYSEQTTTYSANGNTYTYTKTSDGVTVSTNISSRNGYISGVSESSNGGKVTFSGYGSNVKYKVQKAWSGRCYKIGSEGYDVTLIQKALGIPSDGYFGPQTANAVKQFQKTKGLVSDGIVGGATWKALCS